MISIVVPTRTHESLELTMASLMAQTRQDFEIHVVVDYEKRGAPWARNVGLASVRGEYVLFSDNDILWKPTALETMVRALETASPDPDAAGFTVGYAFGGCRITTKAGFLGPFANSPWSFEALKVCNQVPTEALLKTAYMTWWDESLQRLQDWDYWLRMALHQHVKGVWVGEELFSTPERPGISTGLDGIGYTEAVKIVQEKLGLAVTA